jgi:thiol:disulfide interchange protein
MISAKNGNNNSRVPQSCTPYRPCRTHHLVGCAAPLHTGISIGFVLLALLGISAFAAQGTDIAKYGDQQSAATIEPIRLNNKPAVAVVFDGTNDLHFYASSDTAPAPGMQLTVTAKAQGITFGQPVFPKPGQFYDPGQEKKIDVFVGKFEVYLPIQSAPQKDTAVSVTIAGIACTSKLCLPPFEKTLTAQIDFTKADTWRQAAGTGSLDSGFRRNDNIKDSPENKGVGYIYLGLALLAGLSFNIMPCVLPVLPLILSRLIGQAKEKSARRIGLGMAFCVGVILFFVLFAAAAILIKVTTGAVFNWSDQLRYPSFVLAMGLFLVAFGLFMFDVFGIAVPSSLSGGGSTGGGMAGSIGMGFLAALLSTPCSGAILAAVVVWAQTQSPAMSLLAFTLMGVGMALPYAVIVFIPGLLNKLPKPGDWMEHVRKAMGFILLIIAVKLLGALPKERLVDALFYAVILSFCLWMWGSWVNFATPQGKKWTIRIIAVFIAVICGFWLLPEQKQLLNWKPYDAAAIQKAVEAKQPVIIKFTADWCTNCVVVEKRVFHNPQVVELLNEKNVLIIKADTTTKDMPATGDLTGIYGESGTVPVTLILLPNGQQIKLRGIFDKQELLDILQKFPGS